MSHEPCSHHVDYATQARVYDVAATRGHAAGLSAQAVSDLRAQAENLRHEARNAPADTSPITDDEWAATALAYLQAIDHDPADITILTTIG